VVGIGAGRGVRGPHGGAETETVAPGTGPLHGMTRAAHGEGEQGAQETPKKSAVCATHPSRLLA
jgi:hypothetical protein